MSEAFDPTEGVYDGEGDGPIDEDARPEDEIDIERERAQQADDTAPDPDSDDA